MNFLENQMAQNIANRIAIEKSMGKDFTPEDCLDLIEKAGRGAPLGEVRTWNGKEYIKTPKGWRPKPKGYKDGGNKEEKKTTDGEKKQWNMTDGNGIKWRIGDTVRIYSDLNHDSAGKEGEIHGFNGTDIIVKFENGKLSTFAEGTYDKVETKKPRPDYSALPKQAEGLMNRLVAESPVMNDPKLVKVKLQPNGDYTVYYDGEDTGVKASVHTLYDKTIDEMSWRDSDGAESDSASDPKEETNKKLPSDALKVMGALQTLNSKYKDPSKVTVDVTPQGNRYLYYDGKDTGIMVGRSGLSDDTIEKLQWEHHDIDGEDKPSGEKTPSSVKIEGKTFKIHNGKVEVSMYDKDSRILGVIKFAREHGLGISWVIIS